MAILLGVVEIVDFCGRICRLRGASLCVLGGFSPISTCAYTYHPPPPAVGVKAGLALVTHSLSRSGGPGEALTVRSAPAVGLEWQRGVGPPRAGRRTELGPPWLGEAGNRPLVAASPGS